MIATILGFLSGGWSKVLGLFTGGTSGIVTTLLPYLLCAAAGAYGWYHWWDAPRIALLQQTIATADATAQAQDEKTEATIAAQVAVTKEVQDEAQEQIGNMAAGLSDLSVRVVAAERRGSIVSAAPICPAGADAAIGPATTAGGGRPAGDPGQPVQIDAGVLRSAVTAGRDALKAELLWRAYARGTGQAR